MKRYLARDLAAMSKDELWQLPDDSEVTIIFDPLPDGTPQTIVADIRAARFSAYCWVLFVEYPHTPMKLSHFLRERLNPTSHLKLLNAVLWDCHDAYRGEVDMEMLTRMQYEAFNAYFNDFSTYLEEEVTTFSIDDFLDVLEEPRIAAAIEGITGSPMSIEHAYRVADEVIKEDLTALTDNPIAQAVRSELVKMNQVKQVLIARGRVTDIDSHFFPEAIPSSFFSGMNSMLESMMESRSSTKAMAYKEKPIQDSEYFNRKLQLMAATVQEIDYVVQKPLADVLNGAEKLVEGSTPMALHATVGDCGSQRYIRWVVKPKDVEALDGKYYLTEEGLKNGDSLRVLTRKDRDTLSGKVIYFRSPLLCNHPSPQSVCAVCYGELALSIPRFTNIGHVAAVEYGERVTQNMLGIKHVDFATGLSRIILGAYEREYIEPASDSRGITLVSRLKPYKLWLSISPNEANQLTEIQFVEDVTMLPVGRISEVSEIYLTTEDPQGERETATLNVDIGGKKAHLSHGLLAHIQRNGYALSDTGRYVVDLEGFDREQTILEVPNRDENILDYLGSIIQFISSTDDGKDKSDPRGPDGRQEGRRKMLRRCKTPEEALLTFHELTSAKMPVNMVHLEILVYSTMARSIKDRDYRLPYPGNALHFGQLPRVIASRSQGGGMAFEKHSSIMNNPATYINRNLPSHPLDDLLVPKHAAH
jgi:hypothetical protein